MSSGADRRSAGPCWGGDFRTPYRPVGFGAPADVRERITIGVPAAVVYAAVSDVRRMGEWSPECVGATLAEPDAEPVTGTRFTGRNRIGRWRAWTTRCIVTVADRPRCFAFDVSVGGRVATWRFDLIPSPDGTSTEVVQSWWDRRGPARRRLSALTSGIGDRATHNKATMRVSLRRLKRAMEDSFALSGATSRVPGVGNRRGGFPLGGEPSRTMRRSDGDAQGQADRGGH